MMLRKKWKRPLDPEVYGELLENVSCMAFDAALGRMMERLEVAKTTENIALFLKKTTFCLNPAISDKVNRYFRDLPAQEVTVQHVSLKLCLLGVAPEWDTPVLWDILCCANASDPASLQTFVDRKQEQLRVRTITIDNRMAYQSHNTDKGINQAKNQFLDYCIFAMSSNGMFGVRAGILQRVGTKVQFKVNDVGNALVSEGICLQPVVFWFEPEKPRADDVGNALVSEGICLQPVVFWFEPEKPRADQPGSKLEWESPQYEKYRVVMKRKDSDPEVDKDLLELIWTTRFRLYDFACRHPEECNMRFYTLEPRPQNSQVWGFESLLLSEFDMYRTFACDVKSSRSKLYGFLAWTNCTYKILVSLKMKILSEEPFGTKTTGFMQYCFDSPLTKKLKSQSMQRLLTKEALRHFEENLPKNLVLPISETAQESICLFLATLSGQNLHAGVILVLRCMIHTLLDRPNTVDQLMFANVLDPQNATKAVNLGEFTFAGGIGKTSFTVAINQNTGLSSHGRLVLPNFKAPWKCALLNLLVSIVQSQELSVSSRKFDLNSRLLDSISAPRPRRTKILRKGRSREEDVKIADSSAVNKRLIQQFRADTSFPAVDFLHLGFVSDEEQSDRLCTAEVKQQVCGRDCSLALYSEKKAAANKALSNRKVDFLMLEERMYGDSSASDAARLVKSKRHNRNALHYVSPHLRSRDKVMAQVLADHDAEDPRPSQIWKFARITLSDNVLRKIKSIFLTASSPFKDVLEPYGDAFAILAAIGFVRYPAFARQRITLFKHKAWLDNDVANAVRELGNGVELLLRAQRPSDSDESLFFSMLMGGAETMEVLDSGEIVSSGFIKYTKTARPAFSRLVSMHGVATPFEQERMKQTVYNDLDRELKRRLEELDRLKEQCIADHKFAKERFDAEMVAISDHAAQQQKPEPAIAESVVAGEDLFLFLKACGFAEKHSEARDKSGVSHVSSSLESYSAISEANTVLFKTGGRDNAGGEKSGNEREDPLVADIHRYLVAWHFGKPSLPALKSLPNTAAPRTLSTMLVYCLF